MPGNAQNKRFKLIVDQADEGIRLDVFVAESCKESLTRSQVKRCVNDGLITVNNLNTKANYLIHADDIIDIEYTEKKTLDVVPEKIDLDVVFEDDDLLVINKQPGLVVHPGAGNKEHTLVNALQYYTNGSLSQGSSVRPGIVHRLDKDTSGVLVVAKNDWTHARLSQQFKNRTVKKKYTALVRGVVQHDQGKCDQPLGRGRLFRKKILVLPDIGKPSLTEYSVAKRFSQATLLNVQIHTGRTHQIRVHMAYLGHPVLGDKLYGKPGFPIHVSRQCLHASFLEFIHPRTKKNLSFQLELPIDILAVIDKLQ